MANILDRLDSAMFLGAKIWIAKLGEKVQDEEQQEVSNTFHPAAPTSYADPGAWTLLGGMNEAKVEHETESKEIKRVLDDGRYHTQEIKLVKKSNIKFTTPDITPEAFRLTFGLEKDITDTKPQKAFAAGVQGLEVWVCIDMTDGYRGENQIARVIVRARLSLENPVEAKDDVATAQYDLSVIDNELNEFTAKKLIVEPSA